LKLNHKVIDYLVSLNIPLVLTDDQNQLEYLIRNYAKHRGISEAEAISFFERISWCGHSGTF